MDSLIDIGIVGSRLRCSASDCRFVFQLVEKLKQTYGDKLRIVSGACRSGADAFAASACKKYNVQILEHPVNISTPIKGKWDYRERAFARNTLVARDARHALFALVWDGRKGGTEDTITKYSEYILAGESRKLYLVYTDLRVEKWRPTVKKMSSWEICQGTVSRVS